MSRQVFAVAALAMIGAVTLASPSHATAALGWYEQWLLSRQDGAQVALYNRPCTVSDGLRETIVPCQIAAAALDGEIPLYPQAAPGPGPGVIYFHRHHWRRHYAYCACRRHHYW